MKSSIFTVEQCHAGMRMDKFLAETAGDLSRTRAKKLISIGCVQVNGVTNIAADYKVKSLDKIAVEIAPCEDSEMEPVEIPIEVVYENEEFMVINKQAGLTVHPGAGNHYYTLANALLAYCGDNLSGIGGVKRPGIVHRLDKDTSGLMVVAKTDNAHNNLCQQIRDRDLKRQYWAVCWGVPVPYKGKIEANIGRDVYNRKKMTVLEDSGKVAITNYKVLEVFGNNIASLVQCNLDTGRTHQIRVHMNHKGNPLVGDQTYGSSKKRALGAVDEDVIACIEGFKRQALHSCFLGCYDPLDNQYREFAKDMPEDMQTLVDKFRLC